MNYDETTKINYKGIDIICPQCGRKHGLGIERSCLSTDSDLDEVWMQCPACGLRFEGVAVTKWRRSEKFKELNEAIERLSAAFKPPYPTQEKIGVVWTVYFLDENNHEVKKCFRTQCDMDSINYILGQLNRTCRPGEKYTTWEELD